MRIVVAAVGPRWHYLTMTNTTNSGIFGRTNLGYALFSDLTYRYTVVSGVTHVDEYVRGFGTWVYLGTIPTKAVA